MIEKIDYPVDLLDVINSGRGVPLVINSRQVGGCINCGGNGFLLIFEKAVGAKPLKNAPMAEISKWFDAGTYNCDPQYSGWYVGRTIQSECPACSIGTRKRWLENHCGLSATNGDREISLEYFKTNDELSGKQAAKDFALSILSQNSKAHGFVTFYGSFGCGKTHILKSLVNGLRGVGLWSVYATLSNILEDIHIRFGEPNGSVEVANVINYYRSIRVLCLDEVEKFNPTGWRNETVFRLIDDRYQQKDNLLTVFASNKAPAELPVELGYMASRFTEGAIVEVPGPDMRPAIGEIEEDWTDK